MFTIAGSGFGLYGYLPALVDAGEEVVLPAAYRAKVEARPELAAYAPGVRWAADADAALEGADAIVIATPPARQLELALRCLALPSLGTLLLEKPVAPTPREAIALLDALRRAGKRYRVGYTLLHAAWAGRLAAAMASGAPLSIRWRFKAHHYARDLRNWKRFPAQGGGALRFFGIHVLALLARIGYREVLDSVLRADSSDEAACWEASFEGPGLGRCTVLVDSRSAQTGFEVALERGGKRERLLRLDDPFAEEVPKGGGDRRIGVLARLLATLDERDAPFAALYDETDRLWLATEEASRFERAPTAGGDAGRGA
jgi:predicted dehydrogenase